MKTTIYSRIAVLILFTFIFGSVASKDLHLTISGSETNNGQKPLSVIPNPLNPDYVLDPMKDWEKPFVTFQYHVFTKSEHQSPYRLYVPENIKKGEKYPLVLFMHGYGERGIDNRGQFQRFRCVKFWEKYPCYVLAPQTPSKIEGVPNSELVWVDTPFGADSHVMKANPTWPLKLTLDLLDKIIKENKIDSNRIYVTGLSMGGFATWELIQRNTSKFAAAIPVCGGGDLAFAPKLVSLPLWIFHGELDKTVIVERSRNMVSEIVKAGGHPKYTEYYAVHHDSWKYAYNNQEVWEWLFIQSKSLKR